MGFKNVIKVDGNSVGLLYKVSWNGNLKPQQKRVSTFLRPVYFTFFFSFENKKDRLPSVLGCIELTDSMHKPDGRNRPKIHDFK